MEVLWSKTGSKGNASVISDGKTMIQIDAGISYQTVNKGIGYKLYDLSAVIATHFHGDRPYFVCERFSQKGNESICQQTSMA